jgi:hypothetical protein
MSTPPLSEIPLFRGSGRTAPRHPKEHRSANLRGLWLDYTLVYTYMYISIFFHLDGFKERIIVRSIHGCNRRSLDSAIAQAISRWLPTAEACVRSRVWSSGICGGQSGAGAGFLRVLRFPLPILFPLIAPQSPSHIIWGWYNRPEVAAVQRSRNEKKPTKSIDFVNFILNTSNTPM